MIDTGKLIHKILVYPDSQQWFIDIIKSISAKYDIRVQVSQGLHGNK